MSSPGKHCNLLRLHGPPTSRRGSCVPKLGLSFPICERTLGLTEQRSTFLPGVEVNPETRRGRRHRRAVLAVGRAWRGRLCSGSLLQVLSLRAAGLEEAGSAAPHPRPGLRAGLQQPGRGISLLIPPRHSLGLGTLVLVAAPADGLGPLLVVT